MMMMMMMVVVVVWFDKEGVCTLATWHPSTSEMKRRCSKQLNSSCMTQTEGTELAFAFIIAHVIYMFVACVLNVYRQINGHVVCYSG